MVLNNGVLCALPGSHLLHLAGAQPGACPNDQYALVPAICYKFHNQGCTKALTKKNEEVNNAVYSQLRI